LKVLSWFFICTISLDPASLNDTIPKKFFNSPLTKKNPSSVSPPSTDNGLVPSFKFSLDLAHRSVSNIGWSRFVTPNDLPISAGIVALQVRVYKGTIVGMHWHQTTEWGYVIYGNARVTAVNLHGQSYVGDLKAGDIWFIPSGIPHALQGLGPDGFLFIQIFNGVTSGDNYEIPDWMEHVPPSVLAKNFQVPESTFANLPQTDDILFPGQLLGSLAAARAESSKVTGSTIESYAFSSSQMRPNVIRTGGNVKVIDKTIFPATDVAAAIVTLKPGALRELHWHPNAAEWLYFVEGYARVGIFFGASTARTMDFQAGDIGYVPQSLGHYVENTGKVDVVFLEVYAVPFFEGISLGQFLAHTPTALVAQNLKVDVNFVNSINKNEVVIQP